MDLTQFVASRREALLVGDYNTYRAQLSRQLLATRKRLGRATNKREKFAAKPVTAEDIGSKHEFLHLLLLTSERAWAHAMHLKTTHADDGSGKGLSGSTRSHLISRLSKAAKTAKHIVALLKDHRSKAHEHDVLEALAYHATLAGAEEFEKQSRGQRPDQDREPAWQSCLRSYSLARIVYAALFEKHQKDIYRDVIADTIDPTIRYAAYQAHLSRTIAIPTIAKRYFPNADQELVGVIEQLDPYALKDKPAPKTEAEKQQAPEEIPNSVNWRGRRANIVDASIGQALANVTAAEAKLRVFLSSNPTIAARDRAAAYDEVLNASQDAADAAKSATDELEKERVDEGDARMQNLRVTSLSVNYDLVSWRIGRYRALIGEEDGLTFEPQLQKKPKRPRKDGTEYPDKEEPRGRKVARLRERIVLYDAILQSINSVKELPGAVRDEKFVIELDSKASYFRALKCLNISYSHGLLANHLNALALLKRAQDLLASFSSTAAIDANDAPLTLDITTTTFAKAKGYIDALVSRTHAIAEMRTLEANFAKAAEKGMTTPAPLVHRLNDYPRPGTQVDLTNLVTYPPTIEPVPVKPLFLDVAFNYIEYPGRRRTAVAPTQAQPTINGVEEAASQQPQKRGWFTFGRS